MFKHLPLIFASLLLLGTKVSATPLSVDLPAYAVKLDYQQPVRLNQVLTDTSTYITTHQHPQPYWLAAQLLEPGKQEQIDNLKTKILEKLQYLAAYHPESAVKADTLATLIRHNNFHYRHFITLDNDLVRLQPELNPLLQGSYQLLVPTRSNTIRVVGSMTTNARVDFIENGNLDDYLTLMTLPDNSNLRDLYVIQPDGTVKKAENAYWNKEKVYLAPGTILFSGFLSLPGEYTRLNDQIAELLRYLPPTDQGSH